MLKDLLAQEKDASSVLSTLYTKIDILFVKPYLYQDKKILLKNETYLYSLLYYGIAQTDTNPY